VAAFIHKELQGILFGLELEIDGKTIVILNPGNYEIPDVRANKVHVYVICEDKKVADQVSTFDMTSEEILQMELEKEISDAKEKKENEDVDPEDMELEDLYEESNVPYGDEDNEL
jgi:hypothetical protein